MTALTPAERQARARAKLNEAARELDVLEHSCRCSVAIINRQIDTLKMIENGDKTTALLPGVIASIESALKLIGETK